MSKLKYIQYLYFKGHIVVTLIIIKFASVQKESVNSQNEDKDNQIVSHLPKRLRSQGSNRDEEIEVAQELAKVRHVLIQSQNGFILEQDNLLY